MDKIIFSGVALALIALGFCLIIWPKQMIAKNRDDEEVARPITLIDIWSTRLLGAALIAGAGYVLYAILAGLPGADFFPV